MITNSFFKSITNFFNDVNQKKSLSYVTIRGFSVVSNYVFSILVIYIFSKEDYGVFVYGLSVFMILCTLLKAGIDVHFVKLFYKFKDEGVPGWIKRLETKVIFSSIIITLFIAVIVYTFNLAGDATNAITLFVLSAPVYVVVHLNSAKLRSISCINKFAFLNIAGRIALSLGFFFILYYVFLFKTSFIIYIAHFLSVVFLLLLSYLWTRNKFSYNKNQSKSIPQSFKSYNKALMMKSYITVLFLWGDRFLLSFVCTLDQLAEYDISLKIAMLIMVVTEALKSSYAPVFARNIKDHISLEKHIKKSTKVGVLFSFLVLITLILFGKNVLGLFGPEFIASYPLVIIISCGYFFSAIFGQADNVVEMCGLAKNYINSYFIIITLSLFTGVILSFKLGPIGMAISFSIGNIMFQAIASQIVYKKLGLKTRLF